ncbi:MAG: hypothetical protein JJU18_13650 [Oceanicaulis sp.]|nr:hypothetical protein [Oceanicaulis sp.]
MPDINTVERFTLAGGLTRTFRVIAARRTDAARLIATDGVFIAAMLLAGFWAWPYFLDGEPEAWVQGLVLSGAFAGFLISILAWDTAWQRFLAGKPLPSGIPWRLGHDEARQLGAWVLVCLISFVLMIMFGAVAMPIYLVLKHAIGASPIWMAILVLPLAFVLFVVIHRLYCGVSLTMARGSMSVFDGFTGVARHLWSFTGAITLLFVLVTAISATFDAARGAQVSIDFMGGNRGPGFPDTWPLAAVWFLLQAISHHVTRGVFMESALVTLHLGPAVKPAAPAPAQA